MGEREISSLMIVLVLGGIFSLVWDEAVAISLAWEEVKKGFWRVIDVLDLGKYAKART